MADSLRAFQLSLGKYLRDPDHEPVPIGLPPRGLKVYEELLFNNICGLIDSCFPVCKDLMGDTIWQALCRRFLREWRSQTPYFHEIPQEFLNFLNTQDDAQTRPPWFTELAYYEWVELHLDTHPSSPSKPSLNAITANPHMMNLGFNWPVHEIGPDYLPDQPCPTFLVVMRNDQQQIQFIEINAATSLLLDICQPQPLTRATLINKIAAAMQCPCNETFTAHAERMIDNLVTQGILLEGDTQFGPNNCKTRQQ